MSEHDLRWPGGKRIAVLFNLCLEQWSDGKAPGISPMGNPLPPGVLDMTAISWAAFGCRRGIYRLLDGLGQHGAKATVMTNAVVAERYPEAVKAVAKAGHEVASHSYTMDVIPAFLSEEDEKKNLDRCSACSNRHPEEGCGLAQPARDLDGADAGLLARAGYRWYGDILDDDLPYVLTFDNRPIVAIPLQTDVNDMPFMKHGSVPAPRSMRSTRISGSAKKARVWKSSTSPSTATSSGIGAARPISPRSSSTRPRARRLDRHPLRDGRARAGASIAVRRDATKGAVRLNTAFLTVLTLGKERASFPVICLASGGAMRAFSPDEGLDGIRRSVLPSVGTDKNRSAVLE